MSAVPRRVRPEAAARRGWCPGLGRPMPTGDGLLARVHPPLGILTLDQARTVAEGARRFGNGHLDLTARANLQIRGVSDATVAALARLLGDVGLGDVRADGGPQRLTLTSPVAGRDADELIDVPALAQAIEAGGRRVPGLPAKTLVVVEGRPAAVLPEADLVVCARAPGTVRIAAATELTFEDLVTCPADQAAAAVTDLLIAFARTGRRRIRDLSPDERGVLAEAVRATPSAPVPRSADDPGHRRVDSGAASFEPAAGLRIRPGLAILAADAPFGRCTAAGLDRVVAAAGTMGSAEIRLSPGRGFVLLAPAGAPAEAVRAALADAFIVAPDDPRRSIDACTGAPGCASGSTPTLTDAARLADAFHRLAKQGSTAHVSGCAKGCARPGPAALTLVARAGRYGAVIGGAPSDEPAIDLPIEAVLERLGRAETVGLAAAFAPEAAVTAYGRTKRPA
jgi:precorrin-3B synthase